jgi:CRP-like cAMP-binding protein
MFDQLRAQVLRSVEMSEEDFDYGTTLMIPKRLRKRQYLLQAGDVCKCVAFVSRGCLRLYSLDDLGKEHIQRFAVEGWWMTDSISYQAQEPAANNIDALEDSELLLIDRTSQEKLVATIPKWGEYLRRELENTIKDALLRISDFVSLSSEDRYKNFLRTYPDIVQRIPLHQIASYLGITPQSLSRIRREVANRE